MGRDGDKAVGDLVRCGLFAGGEEDQRIACLVGQDAVAACVRRIIRMDIQRFQRLAAPEGIRSDMHNTCGNGAGDKFFAVEEGFTADDLDVFRQLHFFQTAFPECLIFDNPYTCGDFK